MFIFSLFDRFVEKYTGDNDGNDDRKGEDYYNNVWNHSSSEGRAFLWRSLVRLYDSVRCSTEMVAMKKKVFVPSPTHVLEGEGLVRE
jgi:hypothetical protein